MTREQWLKERKQIIGSSDASCIVGCNPYKTNIDLYKEKIGLIESEDIGDKPYVKYGVSAESSLRELFKLDYPQYQVDYNEFKIHRNPQFSFIGSTLDGELLDQESRERGVLEIKTSNILRAMQKDQWTYGLPQNYYCQCIHQLLSTNWDFCILKAHLKTDWSGEVRINTRHYTIRREEVLEDIKYLKEKEVEFWTEYVLKNKCPPLILPPL